MISVLLQYQEASFMICEKVPYPPCDETWHLLPVTHTPVACPRRPAGGLRQAGDVQRREQRDVHVQRCRLHVRAGALAEREAAVPSRRVRRCPATVAVHLEWLSRLEACVTVSLTL